MSYSEFQNQVSSEKITLALIHASKRLMAWTEHETDIYKLSDFDVQAIVAIEDSGTAYTEVFSLDEITEGTFYNDRDNHTLYLKALDSDNPNGRFLVLTMKLFFSNVPIVLPHDLNDGYEVYWEPGIKATSTFGVEVDVVNQTSEAIEGSGTLTLYNDTDFWRKNYDKLTFENKTCLIYSHNRELEPSEAKLIFKGFIDGKAYTKNQIQLRLKDQLSVLREPVPLKNLEELNLRTSDSMNLAKQRMVLGRVYGHRLTNLDEVLEGYPLDGTVSVNIGSFDVTGTGTQFLSDLSPDDAIMLDGVRYTVDAVISDTTLTLTEEYEAEQNVVDEPLLVLPDMPKRTMNRTWLVAGHALRQPTTEVVQGSSITRLKLGSTQDMQAGDWIYIGEPGVGELVKIRRVFNSQLIQLSTSLEVIPPVGTPVFRPSVQNVRIDNIPLVYERDYTFDASAGILSLSDKAEWNAAPLKKMKNNISFSNGSRTVTGIGFEKILTPGSIVSCVGQAEFFEVLSVDSDEQVTLREPATFTSNSTLGLYKTFVLDPDESVVTCDVLGRTLDGTPTGELLDTAPKIVKAMLVDMGLTDVIDNDSFVKSNDIAYELIGLVVPSTFSDTNSVSYRDVLNRINASVFGYLIQSNDFKLSYMVLRPRKVASSLRLDEADILDFSINSIAEKLVKQTKVNYRAREYDYVSKDSAVYQVTNVSENGTYVLKTTNERILDTFLINDEDAKRYAARWALILENATSTIKLKTKLQAMNLDIGNIVDISHRKIYERLGTFSSSRKLAMVEGIKKSGTMVEISLVDLSNMFNRVACICDDETRSWSQSDEDWRIYGGFITDDYGIIDDDQNSVGLNLIW